ncbi:MAG: glutaconyl-CoA decarboxylase subunit alpha [Desulfarculus sp.]|nr:glutaconyl-CoA decarboxylase subunit alpha [Pseudomonadota bacterium]MBV1716224.1 glutaconyl-CoA decarboxylase subunit alpha [Desulfarculus sp.]MBU4573048.1 glutaconyl-CoA decarboxylase subunit alpha [Pseudomonadota bacterium]MBU4599806.1 glutaconyl-CoA decarboxylase subunit alpha [Pseudomonadota bacterium]MBV1738121.1 glutaconyl-CoA decarboxylase subunit alpha [Desulfarculus sp.]
MHPYFKNMPTFGKALSDKKKAKAEDNKKSILEVEAKIAEEIERVKNAGLPAEKIHSRGQLTVWDRIEKLVDPGTFRPLHILLNPKDNEEGTTGVVDGLAKIEGKWCVLAGFDNKVMAGAWIAGQAENQLRITDLAKRLHIPLVWLVNCSGVKLTEQEEVYADRRGNGTTFFRHAELETKGIPILAGIWGTNPAGGGYQGISPTYLIAHKDCNIAVGGGGIVGGMSPKGGFDVEGAEQLIEATRHFKEVPPGSVGIHYDKTGFFKEVHDTEEGVLNSIRRHMTQMPAYDLDFFRVDEPKEPLFPADDLYYLVNFNQKMSYDFDQCLARLVDGSEHMEFKPGYGPEVYTGLVKLNGLVMGVIGNRQGFMPPGYPEYAGGEYMGIGGKLYRQGLIKMNEFVTLCGRDRVPIIWFQDTSGIDVGDIAEQAELLGLGQSLIYSIEQTGVPQMMVLLRKGTAAAHYVMGGPTANNHNAFTLGTATSEIYVMHGETAAAASFSRRLVKEKDAGRDLQPVIDKMNDLAQMYYDKSRPWYCAFRGFVDEVVNYTDLRGYLTAFAEASYQNPNSLCPHHHMMLPRIIKG